jgi:hypothetical protein
VTERNILIAGAIIGAIAGVAASYMFFTESGKTWRIQAEGNLTAFMQEAEKLLSAADQVRQSVAELRGGNQTGWPRSA